MVVLVALSNFIEDSAVANDDLAADDLATDKSDAEDLEPELLSITR